MRYLSTPEILSAFSVPPLLDTLMQQSHKIQPRRLEIIAAFEDL